MEDKTYMSIQNLPRISPSLLKDVDTGAPISYKARLGWEELLGIPVDLEHYIFYKEEAPEVCEESESSDCYFFQASQQYKDSIAAEIPKNH